MAGGSAGSSTGGSGWNAYTDLATKAGAERCALVGRQNGIQWAGSNTAKTGEYRIVIRDWGTLVKDATAASGASSELHFDGQKYIFFNRIDGAVLGKAGDYACGVKATKNTIIITIVKGTPQAVLGPLAAVYKAVVAAGQ
jgi:hypothetical protein